jgi:hypothetical protein
MFRKNKEAKETPYFVPQEIINTLNYVFYEI